MPFRESKFPAAADPEENIEEGLEIVAVQCGVAVRTPMDMKGSVPVR